MIFESTFHRILEDHHGDRTALRTLPACWAKLWSAVSQIKAAVSIMAQEVVDLYASRASTPTPDPRGAPPAPASSAARLMRQDGVVAVLQTTDEMSAILTRLEGEEVATLQVLGSTP